MTLDHATLDTLRDAPPAGTVMAIDAMAADLELPLERPLFSPSAKPRLAELALAAFEDDIDTARLFDQIVVDKARLVADIRRALRARPQITLCDLLNAAPLQHGLAELIAYLELAHRSDYSSDLTEGFRAVVDDTVEESVRWQACDALGVPVTRQARLPRVIFTRRA